MTNILLYVLLGLAAGALSGLIGIGTGYALSVDGLWRQHSWGVARDLIIESTEARVKYFGRLLRGADADMFAAANA